MARQVRIEYPGATYHVMCRGDRREVIFRDDEDRVGFLTTLGEACHRTGALVHGYVLMSNHYHLLLETPEPNLVATMKWFQGTYTQRFNARHRLSGHLFQGRYKAVPIDAEQPDYFRRVSDYIHLNPVRARLLEASRPDLLRYRWSSFPLFAQSARLPEWMRRERVFGALELPDEGAGSRRRFRARMDRRMREVLEIVDPEAEAQEWRALQRGWYVGSESFRDRLMDLASSSVAGRRRSSYRKEGLRRHDEKAAANLLATGLDRLGLTAKMVRAMRQCDPRKQALAWLIKTRTEVGDRWLIERLAFGHRSNVGRAVRVFRAPTDPSAKRIARLLRQCAD